MTDVSWRGVRERVAAIAHVEASRKVFGASGHGFALHPVLTSAELAALEQAVGVRLPQQYRTFLLEVGNGGAGPGYGIEQVKRTGDGWQWTGPGTTTVARLDIPFQPFDPDIYPQYETKQPVESDFLDHATFVAAAKAWMRGLDDLYDAETFGTIALSHQGCGYFWLLVVSGPERGSLWEDNRAADLPVSPLTDPTGQRVTFGPWYLDWLTRTERAIAAADSQPR